VLPVDEPGRGDHLARDNPVYHVLAGCYDSGMTEPPLPAALARPGQLASLDAPGSPPHCLLIRAENPLCLRARAAMIASSYNY